MSTVRINDNIKKEVMPILDDLGLSLSEAINIFLHQIKLNNGIPFTLKRREIIELNDGHGSYVCEYGHLHDYSKLNVNEMLKDIDEKTYNNVEELKKTLEKEIHVDAGNISEFDISDSKFDNGRIEIKPDTADGKIKVTNISRSQGNPEYYGIIELSLWDEGIVIINETDIEQYLKTVVPSEMPVSFGVEALKVQAVCARSYAYKHLTNVGYALYGAHVDDSTQFQVYNNNLEFDASNQAILATKGEMLRYGDDVVQAYYYSTSCGSGTDVTLWGSSKESYPYYESRDIGSSERNINYMDEESFASFIKQKYDSDYDSTCNYYRWKMTVSDKDLSSSFDSKISDVGIIQNIYVRKRVSGGAAVSVVVEGDKNTVTLDSESLIRQAFGNAAVTLETNGGTVNTPYLPSTFCIFESQEKDGEKYFVITGGGFGHGIGMSQNAVNAMTKQGMSYKDILEFFYPGTKVA